MSADNAVFCESCQFWLDGGVKKDDDDPENRPGICRRFPPVSVLTDSSVVEREHLDPEEWCKVGRAAHDFIYWTQPRTLATEWCGESKLCTPTEEPEPPPDLLREVAQAILEDATVREYGRCEHIEKVLPYLIRPDHYRRLKELLT